MPRLQGKVAVVTGASRGVGRGIALVLGEEGATVYVSGAGTPCSRESTQPRKPLLAQMLLRCFA